MIKYIVSYIEVQHTEYLLFKFRSFDRHNPLENLVIKRPRLCRNINSNSLPTVHNKPCKTDKSHIVIALALAYKYQKPKPICVSKIIALVSEPHVILHIGLWLNSIVWNDDGDDNFLNAVICTWGTLSRIPSHHNIIPVDMARTRPCKEHTWSRQCKHQTKYIK